MATGVEKTHDERGPKMPLLAVEDNDDMRNMIAEALQSDAVAVNAASTGEEAISIIGKDGIPELLITDIDLGVGINGISLARYVRERDPNIPILIISGKPWLLDTSLVAKNVHYLHKPFKLGTLLNTVRKLKNISPPQAGARRRSAAADLVNVL